MKAQKVKGKAEFEKELVIRKGADGCYHASWTLSDGYTLSYVSASDQKANAAKDMIREYLWKAVQEKALIRGCEIFSK